VFVHADEGALVVGLQVAFHEQAISLQHDGKQETGEVK
jgi:hypothetical protein